MSAQDYVQLCPSDKLSDRLCIQRRKGQFCDINLILCDANFPVHSCVIGSSSILVGKLLESSDNKVMTPRLNVLVEFSAEERELFCRECAEKVIDFIYGCGIQANTNHMPHMYGLSKKLDVIDLITLCKSYLTNISPITMPSATVFSTLSSIKSNPKFVLSDTNSKASMNDTEVIQDSGKNCVGWTPVDSSNLSCPKCQDSFFNVMMLQQHCNTHLGKLYSCYVCSYSTLKVPHLLKHVKEANHMEIVCSLCLYEAEDNFKLQEHMNEHENAQPFFCRTCKNRFQTRTALNSHIVKHSTETPFICTVCGRGFKWKQGLQNHMFIHTSTKNHLCDECGYSTAHLKSFQDHKTTHSGIRFKCPISACEFSSARKESVKHHLTTHNKEKSYQCEVCGRAFSLAKNLRRHSAIHDPGAQSAQCPLCSFKTMRSDKFRDHLRSCYKKRKTDDLPMKMMDGKVEENGENVVADNEQRVFVSSQSTEIERPESLFDINQIVIPLSDGNIILDQNPVHFVVCNADRSLTMDLKSVAPESIDAVVNTSTVTLQPFDNPILLQEAVGSEVEIDCGSNEKISNTIRYVNVNPLIHKTIKDQNSIIISRQVSSPNLCLSLTNLSTEAASSLKSQTES